MNFAINLATQIHTASLALADLDLEIAQTKRQLDAIELTAESAIAFDLTLKNDKQRSARLFEALAANEQYAGLTEELQQLTRQRSILLADLELFRNQLSVSKLAERSRIVSKLEQCELADLAA